MILPLLALGYAVMAFAFGQVAADATTMVDASLGKPSIWVKTAFILVIAASWPITIAAVLLWDDDDGPSGGLAA